MLTYPLVVTDMDGTLLRNDKTISERTRAAILQFEAAGGRFTIASGRGVAATAKYVEELRLNTPLLLLNGCLLYDPVTGQDLVCHQIEAPALAAVWPILEANRLHIVVHGPRRGIIRAWTPEIAEHAQLDGITFDVVPDLGPHNAGTVVKVLTIGEPADLDRAEAAILAAGLPVRTVRSFAIYLEVLPPEGGKGSALTELLAHLQMPKERALAVGDWLNDLDLLAAAGTGVAMENAHPGLKEAADRLTASNEDDGVAQVLEAIVAGTPVGTERGRTDGGSRPAAATADPL